MLVAKDLRLGLDAAVKQEAGVWFLIPPQANGYISSKKSKESRVNHLASTITATISRYLYVVLVQLANRTCKLRQRPTIAFH